MADCIAAISTPMASGGVSMIRISGADALKVAAKVFIPKYPVRDIEKMDAIPPHTEILRQTVQSSMTECF